MKITDETLSAFLDGELAEPEMEAVRQRLAEDEALGVRLAELTAVDPVLASRYAHIDERPLPDAVRRLLEKNEPTSGQVIAFPAWRRMQRGFQKQLQQHAAIAAATTLAIGLGLGQLLAGGSADNGDWATVAAGLENTPSGNTVELDTEVQLRPRLTFVNQQGQYCRQFQLVTGDKRTENIACRDTADQSETAPWQMTASVQLDGIQHPDSYQTASGGSMLDNALDQMMAGDAFDANAEANLIAEQWKK